MDSEFFLGLIYNASLLLAMVLVFDLLTERLKQKGSTMWEILAGVVLGTIGLAVMSTNWKLLPGIVFDTRSVLLGITGLFFGWIPTLISLVMTATFRIYQGGGGVYMGVSVIVASCLIGIAWRFIRVKSLHRLSWTEIYIFGVIVHIVMLICTFLLPVEVRASVQASIWLPVMLIYPVATLLLGTLIMARMKREDAVNELTESEEKFSKIFKYGPQIISIASFDDGVFWDVNDAFCETLGYKREDMVGKKVVDLDIWVNIEDRKSILEGLSRSSVVRNREYKFRKKDGKIITCLGSAAKLYIRDRYYLLLLGVNIEDRIRAEDELVKVNAQILAEKQNFESVLMEMGDAVIVTDPKGKIVLVNDAMWSLCECDEKIKPKEAIYEAVDWEYEMDGMKPNDYVREVFQSRKAIRARKQIVFTSKKGSACWWM